jgi:AcrR family transcriptional regulator
MRMAVVRRRADASRNDERIVAAAREVFAEEGPGAQMAAVARRAGVGVGSLYQRFASKQELITELLLAGMRGLIEDAAKAAADPDPWQALAGFIQRSVAAGEGAVASLAAWSPAIEAQQRLAAELREAIEQLVDRAREAGAVRPELTAADVYVLFTQLRVGSFFDPKRGRQLQRRILALTLDGMRQPSSPPLPGPAPTWAEIEQRWGFKQP